MYDNLMQEANCDIILLQESGSLSQDWTTDASSCVVFSSSTYNSPAIILSNTTAKTCVWHREDENLCAVGLTWHGINTVLISVYLPDSGKPDTLFSDAITVLDNMLDEIWISQPWECMIMGGDANVHVHPVEGVIGAACDGRAWDHRSMMLFQLVAKWGFSWTSTFNTAELESTYTHMSYSTKAISILDYVWIGTNTGTTVSAKCEVMHHQAVCSDHYPIITKILLGTKHKKKKTAVHRRKCNFQDIRVSNRFAALMTSDSDEAEQQTLETFGNHIVKSMTSAAHNELLCNTTPTVPMRILVAEESAAVRCANPGLNTHIALKFLNKRKKQIKQRKASEHFAKHGLCAPREDKSVAKTLQPLFVGDKLTFDCNLWEAEFRTLYTGLYTDSENDFATQDARLQLLRSKTLGQDRILVPRFMLCEILSQSGRKRHTGSPRMFTYVCY